MKPSPVGNTEHCWWGIRFLSPREQISFHDYLCSACRVHCIETCLCCCVFASAQLWKQARGVGNLSASWCGFYREFVSLFLLLGRWKTGEGGKWEKNIESEKHPLTGTEVTTEIKCNLVAEFVGMPLLFCPIFHCRNTLCFG